MPERYGARPACADPWGAADPGPAEAKRCVEGRRLVYRPAMDVTRRRFLQLAAGGAAVATLGCDRMPALPQELVDRYGRRDPPVEPPPPARPDDDGIERTYAFGADGWPRPVRWSRGRLSLDRGAVLTDETGRETSGAVDADTVRRLFGETVATEVFGVANLYF